MSRLRTLARGRYVVAVVLLLSGQASAGPAEPRMVPAGAPPPEALRIHQAIGSSAVRDLRLAAEGRLRAGTVVLGDAPIPALTPGLSYPFGAPDLDGDGRDEILAYRPGQGTETVSAIDASDGSTRWSTVLPWACFAWRPVPSPGRAGVDVLLISEGCSLANGDITMSLVRGDSGATVWSRTLSFPGPKIGLVWLGLARDGAAYDVATAMLTGTAIGATPTAERGMTIEYRSLAGGALVGSARIEGEYSLPTAALAGDLDGDGTEDAYAFAPTYGMTLASGGALIALTDRLSSTEVRTVYARRGTDDTFLIDATDLSGDGRADPALLTRSLGPVTGLQPRNEIFHLAVLDGAGDLAAGLAPIVSETLGTSALTLLHPGDLDGDGKQDLILGGERLLYDPADGSEYVTDVAFEALGVRGTIWSRVITTPANNRFGIYAGFEPDAGDLDGDGVADAMGWAYRPDAGFVRSAISQRSGAVLWTVTDASRGATVPLNGDADGDGADELIDRYTETFTPGEPGIKPTVTASFVMADGASLQPIWPHSVTLALPAGGGTATGSGVGGRFEDDGLRDLAFAINVNPSFAPAQRFEECLDGATGSIRWRMG